MICYKDMTFCSVPCWNAECSRRITADVLDDAQERDLDVCKSELKDTQLCPGYVEPQF